MCLYLNIYQTYKKDVDSMTSLTKNSNNTKNTSESLTTPLETNLTVSVFECVSNLQKNADVITLKDLNNTETVFKSSTTFIKTIDRITLQTESPADPNYSSDAVNAAVDRNNGFYRK